MIILRTVKNFSSLNIAASILLFLMAILAAVIANSPMAPLYQGFLLQELHLRIGDFNLFSHGGHPLKMIEFINDCLMTVFFLAVGLEIKRELLVGELSSFRKASLPFVAACGGMLVPVIVYSLWSFRVLRKRAVWLYRWLRILLFHWVYSVCWVNGCL